jgi:general secretion pathway protein D
MVRLGALALALVMCSACATARAVRNAEAAGRRGDWDTAVAYYREAFTRDPNRLEVRITLERAMRYASADHLKRARDLEAQDQLQGAAAEYRLAAELDPGNTLALTHAQMLDTKIRDLIEANRPKSRMDEMRQQAAQSSPIPHLDPRTHIDLDFTRPSRIGDILSILATQAGISILYDQNIPQINQPYTITFVNTPLETALTQVLSANGLTFKISDSKSIFVYVDNATNRQKYEEQFLQVFYLSHADITEINQILTQLLTTGPPVRPVISPNKTANSLNVRATAPVMALIDEIIRANDKPRAEVLIDIEILEVDRTRLKQLGIDLSTWGLGLTFSPELAPPNSSGSFPPIVPPPFNLNTLGRGVSPNDFYTTFPSAQIKLLESDSKTRLLAKPQLRGREGSTLQLNLGDDIPVPTTTIPVTTGGTTTGPATSFTLRSTGVNVTITAPRVTYQDEIIMDLMVEKSALGQPVQVEGQSLPSFTSRRATTSLRLRDGESNLLAGLIREEDIRTQKGIPGLQHVPFLRALFGNADNNFVQSDIIMIVTPHIVRSHEVTADDLRPVSIGTQNNIGLGGPPALIAVGTPPAPGTVPLIGGAPTGGTAIVPVGAAPPPAAPPATPPAPRAVGLVPVEPVPSGAAPGATPPTAPAQIVIRPPGTEALPTIGGPYPVLIEVANVSQLGTVSLTVTYNPAVLKAITVLPGTFLQQGGATPTFVPRIDAAAGRIDIAISRAGNLAGASGITGLLASIQFQAVAPGSSPITVTGVATTPGGQPITVQMVPATVTVK